MIITGRESNKTLLFQIFVAFSEYLIFKESSQMFQN